METCKGNPEEGELAAEALRSIPACRLTIEPPSRMVSITIEAIYTGEVCHSAGRRYRSYLATQIGKSG